MPTAQRRAIERSRAIDKIPLAVEVLLWEANHSNAIARPAFDRCLQWLQSRPQPGPLPEAPAEGLTIMSDTGEVLATIPRHPLPFADSPEQRAAFLAAWTDTCTEAVAWLAETGVYVDLRECSLCHAWFLTNHSRGELCSLACRKRRHNQVVQQSRAIPPSPLRVTSKRPAGKQ